MPSSLAQKLNLKPDMFLEVSNIPANWEAQLGKELPANPVKMSISERPAAVLIFIKNKEQFEEITLQVIPNLPSDCVFWMAYPKGTSGVETDLNRDILWKMFEPTGWRPVRMVALDEVWSCMRFRPVDAK